MVSLEVQVSMNGWWEGNSLRHWELEFDAYELCFRLDN